MKTRHALALTTVFALVVSSIPLLAASGDDNRIVSAAKKSYVYRTYLSDDHIKIQSKDGAVTLTGEVSDRSHKSMAVDTVENLPGVKSVLYTLALILIIAWLLGLVSSYTMGGFIHILLVIAIIVILVRVFQGNRIM